MAPIDDEMDARRERAARRAAWTGRKTTLAESGLEPRVVSPEQALALMWELSTEAWLLSGRTLPDYERTATPVRVWRNGERPRDDEV